MTSTPEYTLLPLETLSADDVLQRYEDLTFPPLARRLAVRPRRGDWSGAVAIGESGPVGLALLEADDSGVAQLFSLTVLPADRRRGLGSGLVALAEDLARSAGAKHLELAYRTSWRSQTAIEALLATRGWSTPETRLVLARGETDVGRPLLQTHPPPLPPEAEIFSWEDLTEAEHRSILDRQQQDRWYPEILTPFQEEPRLEPTVSVGLRWRGEVAGWLICHRVTFDTLQYSALFLRPDLHGSRLGWALIREAVRRRLADPTLRYTILAIDARNQRMLHLLETHLRDFLLGTSELRVSRKTLGDAG